MTAPPPAQTPTSVSELINNLISLLYRHNSRNSTTAREPVSYIPAGATDLIDALSSLKNIIAAYQSSPNESELLICLEQLESKIKSAPYYDETLRMLRWELKKGEWESFIERIKDWKKKNIQVQVLEDLKKLDFSNETVRNQAFSTAITNIRSQPKERGEIAIKTLSWLTRSHGPITVPQLQVAVSLVSGQHEVDQSALPSREILLDVCSGLVTIDLRSDRIRLAHYSLPDYLLEHSIVPPDADATISVACLTYLMFPVFSEIAGASEGLESRNAAYPLLSYAALYLRHHLVAASDYEEVTADVLLKFLTSPNIESSVEAQYSSKDSYLKPRQNSLSALHNACGRFENLTVARRLLEDGADVNAEGTGDSRTPLNFASFNWHKKRTEFVMLLLDNGASLEVIRGGTKSHTVLHVASHYGSEDVVRLLLKRFPDEKLLEKYGPSCIFSATWNGHEGIVKLFLENGVKPDTCEREFETPENWRANHFKAHDEDSTPLHVAAHGCNLPLVSLLLQYGADLKRANSRGFTALHYAVDFKVDVAELEPERLQTIINTIKLLLESEADVNAVDKKGRTSLSIAAGWGCSSVVETLLLGGADVGIVDKEGKTARERAEASGYKDVVGLIDRDDWELVGKGC